MNDNTEAIRLYKENKNNKIEIIHDFFIIHCPDGVNNKYIQVSDEKPYSMRVVTIYGATYQDFVKEFTANPNGLTIKYEDSYFQLSDEQFNTLDD